MTIGREQGNRSAFVSVLAWVFIVLAGFSTAIAVVQNIMLATMFASHPFPVERGPGEGQVPAIFRFMMNHIQLFFIAFLAISSGTLVAAVGLLRRKNWARVAFVGILALGIAWNVAGLAFQEVVFASMPAVPSSAPPDFRAEFDRMATVMRVFSLLMALGLSVLFAWLIKRLLSKTVRAEFGQAL